MKRQFIAIGTLLAAILVLGGVGVIDYLALDRVSALSPLPVAQAQTLADTGVVTTTARTATTSVTADESAFTIFLPLVFQNFCSDSFSFDETIRYNLSAIEASQVWYCYRGQDVIVAVVDTGVDQDHPDLAANMVGGRTFVSGTSSPEDDQGHGTHVAGIVAGVGNNGSIIGVAPEARIMPVKVLDSLGSGTWYDVADGIVWAADNGAQIINLSLGSVSYSYTVADAVNYANDKGVLLMAAGGNCGDSSYYLNGCSYQDQPVYPAALTGVVAVASTTSTNQQSSFSNQGWYIELAAPGSFIYSTYKNNEYAFMSGTSQATPHVAGAAALIWAKYPGWSNEEVRSQLRNTTVDLGTSGWDSQFGYGLIQASAALGVQQTSGLETLEQPLTAASSSNDEAVYAPGEVIVKLRPEVTVNDLANGLTISTAEVQVMDTIPDVGVQRLAVAEGQELALVEQLQAAEGVEFAELNYLVSIR
jgi:type VII secretion-associated serine protease mycosin